VVGTKADRVSNNVLAKNVAALKRAHEVSEILPISSKTDAGIKSLWSHLLAVAEQE
jgi:GTP-binding protein